MKEKMRHEFNAYQKIMAALLGMRRINKDSIDFKWGYFSPRFGLELSVDQGFYFENNYRLNICFIWGKFHIHLPFKTKLESSCEWPSYGFMFDHNTFWIKKGKDQNIYSLPFFSWKFDWHKIQLPDGSWSKYRYYEKEKAHIESHDYKYVLNSGKTQERKAICYVERRQWHRKWIPFITKRNTCINITFSDEIGERTGSWKGGCVGCSYDLLKGETIEQCLRRMEKDRKF